MPLPDACVANAVDPHGLDAVLESRADVLVRVNEPDPVRAVEDNAKEDGIGVRLAEEEDERVLSRVCS